MNGIVDSLVKQNKNTLKTGFLPFVDSGLYVDILNYTYYMKAERKGKVSMGIEKEKREKRMVRGELGQSV